MFSLRFSRVEGYPLLLSSNERFSFVSTPQVILTTLRFPGLPSAPYPPDFASSLAFLETSLPFRWQQHINPSFHCEGFPHIFLTLEGLFQKVFFCQRTLPGALFTSTRFPLTEASPIMDVFEKKENPCISVLPSLPLFFFYVNNAL